MARGRAHASGCGGLLGHGDAAGGAGKPLIVAHLLGDDRTATALEADLLATYGVDLLDFYRRRVSLRRICVLVQHLPDHAAVWRALSPGADWTRAEVLALATERRVAALWAVVFAAFGGHPTASDLAPPVPLPGHADRSARTAEPSERQANGGEPVVLPLRRVALIMRGA